MIGPKKLASMVVAPRSGIAGSPGGARARIVAPARAPIQQAPATPTQAPVVGKVAPAPAAQPPARVVRPASPAVAQRTRHAAQEREYRSAWTER